MLKVVCEVHKVGRESFLMLVARCLFAVSRGRCLAVGGESTSTAPAPSQEEIRFRLAGYFSIVVK